MVRRRQLMAMQISGLNTSPVIDEYGVHWNRTFGGKQSDDGWCITKYYDVIGAPRGEVNIMGFVGADSTTITFQYYFSDGATDWYYFNKVYPRRLPASTSKAIVSISFSIEVSEIENSYAYLVETGQIIFAGKNTPYYGYTNISEMPTE